MAAADAPELDEVILAALADGVVEDTWVWAATRAADHQRVVGAVKSLEAEGYVTAEATTTEILALTAEAEGYVARGSPEAQLFAALPVGGGAMTEAELEAAFSKEFVAIAKGKALKNKWIARDAASGAYRRAVEAVGRDELVEQLGSVRAGGAVDEKLVKDLLKRKLVEKRCAREQAMVTESASDMCAAVLDCSKRTSFRVSKGPAYAPVRRKLPSDITKEMLES